MKKVLAQKSWTFSCGFSRLTSWVGAFIVLGALVFWGRALRAELLEPLSLGGTVKSVNGENLEIETPEGARFRVRASEVKGEIGPEKQVRFTMPASSIAQPTSSKRKSAGAKRKALKSSSHSELSQPSPGPNRNQAKERR